MECTTHIQNLSDFKSIFLRLEAEFHHLVGDIAKPINFHEVFKTSTFPVHFVNLKLFLWFQSGPLKKMFSRACRICFKVSSSQKCLKPNDSFITIISQCLPNCVRLPFKNWFGFWCLSFFAGHRLNRSNIFMWNMSEKNLAL